MPQISLWDSVALCCLRGAVQIPPRQPARIPGRRRRCRLLRLRKRIKSGNWQMQLTGTAWSARCWRHASLEPNKSPASTARIRKARLGREIRLRPCDSPESSGKMGSPDRFSCTLQTAREEWDQRQTHRRRPPRRRPNHHELAAIPPPARDELPRPNQPPPLTTTLTQKT